MDTIVEEVRIRKMNQLSDAAQAEVREKLKAMNTSFNFQGYVKISYTYFPLRVVSVDPIEGVGVEYIDNVFRQAVK